MMAGRGVLSVLAVLAVPVLAVGHMTYDKTAKTSRQGGFVSFGSCHMRSKYCQNLKGFWQYQNDKTSLRRVFPAEIGGE